MLNASCSYRNPPCQSGTATWRLCGIPASRFRAATCRACQKETSSACQIPAMTNRNESEEEEEEREEERGRRKRIHGIIEINLKYENDDTTDTTTRRQTDGPTDQRNANSPTPTRRSTDQCKRKKRLLRDGKELRWGEQGVRAKGRPPPKTYMETHKHATAQ